MTWYVERTPSHRPTVKCRSLTNEFHEEVEQEALGNSEAPASRSRCNMVINAKPCLLSLRPATFSGDTRYALSDTHLQTLGLGDEQEGKKREKKERRRKGGKKMRCKLTPSYSILLLLFLLFFSFISYLWHPFVSNQLRYLFANLEHLLLRKRKGVEMGKEIFKKEKLKKTSFLMVKRKTEG